MNLTMLSSCVQYSIPSSGVYITVRYRSQSVGHFGGEKPFGNGNGTRKSEDLHYLEGNLNLWICLQLLLFVIR